MNTSYDVKFWEIRRNETSKTPSYVVRWKVGGRQKSKTLRTKALAENLLSDLRQAAKRGEAFDMETGLPLSMLQAKSARTVFEFVRAYIDMKWPHAAAKSRDSMSDALDGAPRTDQGSPRPSRRRDPANRPPQVRAPPERQEPRRSRRDGAGDPLA